MKLTTNGIAKLANVSIGTVDRALNGRSGISEATKKRILDIAYSNGYVPNAIARSLSTGKSNSVGVVVFDLRNRHFSQLVGAVEETMRFKGVSTYICLSEKDKSVEKTILDNLISRNVDGIILMPIGETQEYQSFLTGLKLPIVTITNRVGEAFPYVGGDFRSAVTQGMNAFYNKGYREIYFVCPPAGKASQENVYAQLERLNGYIDFKKDYPDVRGETVTDYDYLTIIRRRIARATEKIGVFCSSDYFALSIMRMAREQGLSIPGDFGLMGFDGIDTLDHIEKRLCTLEYKSEEVGRESAEILLDMIDKRDVPREVLLKCAFRDGNTI